MSRFVSYLALQHATLFIFVAQNEKTKTKFLIYQRFFSGNIQHALICYRMRKFVCFKENGCQNSYFQNFYNDYIKQVFAVFKINHVVFASSNHLFIAFTELIAYINLQIKSSHKNVVCFSLYNRFMSLFIFVVIVCLFCCFDIKQCCIKSISSKH